MAYEQIDGAILMARNAELERQCQRGEELNAVGWPDTAEGRRWQGVADTLLGLRNELSILERVAGFDPKNPPKG